MCILEINGEEGGCNLGEEVHRERTSRGRLEPKITGATTVVRERGKREQRKKKKGSIKLVYGRLFYKGVLSIDVASAEPLSLAPFYAPGAP
jgi:hypothetical protein